MSTNPRLVLTYEYHRKEKGKQRVKSDQLRVIYLVHREWSILKVILKLSKTIQQMGHMRKDQCRIAIGTSTTFQKERAYLPPRALGAY